MAAFIFVEATIHKPAEFARYAAAVQPLVQQFGGVYRIIAGAVEPLEGEPGIHKVVMHEWPDMAAARRFWDSPEYQEIKALREGTGEFVVRLIDGVDTASEVSA